MTLYTPYTVLLYNKILHYKGNIIKLIFNIAFVLSLSVLQILISITSVFFPFIFNTASIHPSCPLQFFFMPFYDTLHQHFSSLITAWILSSFDMKHFMQKQKHSGRKSRTVHCSHKVRVIVTSWYPLGTKPMKERTV